jgi:hypothetical protein
MAAFNKFHAFIAYLAEGKIDLEGDDLKLVLSNSAPDAANSLLADITEISAGSGYTAGGIDLTVASSGQTSGTYKLVLDDITLVASGGSIGPFRYFVLVDDTPTVPLKPLIGWWDYGSSVTLVDGQSLPVDFSASNGVLQVA